MIEQLDLLEAKFLKLINARNEALDLAREFEKENRQLKQQVEMSSNQTYEQESEKKQLELKVKSLEKELSEFNSREGVIKNKLVNIIDKLNNIESEVDGLKQQE